MHKKFFQVVVVVSAGIAVLKFLLIEYVGLIDFVRTLMGKGKR